jgi:predicted transcriptional regulator YdeE
MREALLVAALLLAPPCLAATVKTSDIKPGQETAMSQSTNPSPQPLIVRRGELLLAGARYAGDNKQGEIPAMWQQELFPRLDELAPLISEKDAFYGVGRALPGAMPGHFQYLAAAPVKSLDKLPEGMVGWKFPPRTYAVLLARGVADIGRVNSFYDTEWLPKSSFVRDGDYMLEYYPPGFPDERIYLYFPVRPKQAGEQEPMTIYDPEPRIEEKPELKIVGIEDLIVNNECVRTGKPVPSLFQAVAVRGHDIKHLVDANILIGDNRSDDPARLWDGPIARQLAGNEVTAFEDVPADMSMRLIPPSKYAIFSCEAPLDPDTKKPLIWADFGPLYPWYAFNRARWGFKEKLYYLEVYYHVDVPEMGYPVARYELWIPIE